MLSVLTNAQRPIIVTMTAHDPRVVLENKVLMSSLQAFADWWTSQNGSLEGADERSVPEKYVQVSSLLLEVTAAADFFSLNPSHMANPRPTPADIFLERHILPGVPEGLWSAICAIAVVAPISFLLGRAIAQHLSHFTSVNDTLAKKRV